RDHPHLPHSVPTRRSSDLHRPSEAPYDFVLAAREEGNNIVQAFHPRLASRRSKSNAVLKDVVAFANTNGGTIFIGLDAKPDSESVGVANARQAAAQHRDELDRFLTTHP